MADRLPWEPSGKPRTMKRAGIVIDLRRCVGCHACSVSCKTEHDVALGVFRTRVRYLERPKATQLAFLPLLCHHCEDAPCIPVCPTKAMTRKEDGRVVVDQKKCDGNMECIAACPYDAIQLDPQTGKAEKCVELLAGWAPSFAARVADQSTSPLYRAAARLTAFVLDAAERQMPGAARTATMEG